jgi:hypothetical protein
VIGEVNGQFASSQHVKDCRILSGIVNLKSVGIALVFLARSFHAALNALNLADHNIIHTA